MVFSDTYIKTLKQGGIGIVPTDTLYGVVGSAFSKQAVERIYSVKGRNLKKPLIILISSLSDLESFGVDIPPQKLLWLNTLWPGKVSVIMGCEKEEFYYLHRGEKSLAFRLPKSQELLSILTETGPLVAPSANKEGDPPARTIEEARQYFGELVDFYVDAGVKTSPPSTLIDIRRDEPKILRKGAFEIQ